jgi:glycosyl-4,4'-diaponeurosporenoate acyltransferase
MPLIELSLPVTIVLDTILWLIIHLGFAKLALVIPDHYFKKNMPKKAPNARVSKWILEHIFFIKVWKKYLPDGGKLFKTGFEKKHLNARNYAYYEKFYIETKRAEWTHYFQMLPAPIFFLFNPVWVGFFMIGYALLANMPCILTQKYNQPRLLSLMFKARA